MLTRGGEWLSDEEAIISNLRELSKLFTKTFENFQNNARNFDVDALSAELQLNPDHKIIFLFIVFGSRNVAQKAVLSRTNQNTERSIRTDLDRNLFYDGVNVMLFFTLQELMCK